MMILPYIDSRNRDTEWGKWIREATFREKLHLTCLAINLCITEYLWEAFEGVIPPTILRCFGDKLDRMADLICLEFLSQTQRKRI